ncbi:hypothetical protein NE664_04465 [Anaerotignum faecicola]|nr:hypothetical protein [Anaerotignum faecicola]
MALGLMAVFMGIILAVSITSIILLLVVTNPKAVTFIIGFTAVAALFVAYINASSRPTNDVAGIAVSYCFGILPLAALVLRFGFGKYDTVSKLLIGASIVISVIMIII